MGADEAYLVSAREFGGSDTYATSQILAAAINKIGVEKDDIVLCGRQAIDGDTAQVGPQIAEKLHLPQITYAAEITKNGDEVTVKRMLEDGYMTIKVQTPCLLTCIKELNEPRYMSVGGVFEAYGKPLTTLGYEDLKDDPLIDATTIGLKGSPTNIFKSFTPPQKGARHDAGGRLIRLPARSWPVFWPLSTSSKKGDRKSCLISIVLISLLSRMYGCSASSARAS